MNFNINDKVVCVRDSWSFIHEHIGPPPVKGGVYVVEALDRDEGIILVGRKTMLWGIEVGWYYMNFRKLEDIQAENKLKKEEGAYLEEAKKLINSL